MDDFYENDDHRISDRLDRDLETEGAHGRYTPFRRGPAIEAAGVLHPCAHDLVEYVGVRGRITHKVCARCREVLGTVGGAK